MHECQQLNHKHVSILAPLARGALRAIRQWYFGGRVVSILAPLARGALHANEFLGVNDARFQSSPPLQGGRYGQMGTLSRSMPAVSILAPLARGALRRGGRVTVRKYWFQSSPPLQGGRYNEEKNKGKGQGRFNPRPPCKGGATVAYAAPRLAMPVSILAPLARGALLVSLQRMPILWRFQSSPPLQGGRYAELRRY